MCVWQRSRAPQQYGYRVESADTGNFQQRTEERDGQKVTGSYQVSEVVTGIYQVSEEDAGIYQVSEKVAGSYQANEEVGYWLLTGQCRA